MLSTPVFQRLEHLFNNAFLAIGLNGGILIFDANLHPTHVLDIQNAQLIAELVKTMAGVILSTSSTLFYYIIYHEKINTWFKSIKWSKKKKNEETNISPGSPPQSPSI